MSVGIGIAGRDITMTLGGNTILGTTSKGMTFTNSNLDVTDDASSGWQEFAADPGLKSAELSFNGYTKNFELVKAYFAASQIFEVIITYPDNSTVTADMVLNSLSVSGESNGVATFEISFASSGSVAFVAGT